MGDIRIENGKLNLYGAELGSLSALPANVLAAASSVTELNCGSNALRSEHLVSLGPFDEVEVLVLDNNELDSLEGLPSLPKLHTLWLNNNRLGNIEEVLNVLSRCCPRLNYLSLLRNPCAPHELMGKGAAEYSRFRVYVKHRLPKLQYLDAAVFDEQETQTAKERGQFYHTATPKQPSTDSQKSFTEGKSDPQEPVDLFEKAEEADSTRRGAFFSQQRHFYSGKTSEGNRFIRDDVL